MGGSAGAGYRRKRRMRKIPAVVFADVDGVPAPHADARASLAGLLEALARERIMLVFCSRRTRAQVESTRQAFGVFHPFVCEGGGAAFVPERYYGADVENTRKVGGYHAVEFAQPYEQVVATVRRAADRLNLGILGFSDMSVEQVARECGLSLLEARLAKLREYSEPFRLLRANPVAERRLCRALEGAGLVCRRGDPFHEVSSAKGPEAAIAVLTTLYRMAFGTVLTAAAHDGAASQDIISQVDLELDPFAVERDDPQAAQRWLEWIVREIDIRREARSPRAARLAR
jgi:mannosyl-3-phosphoglycerate phosphatase